MNRTSPRAWPNDIVGFAVVLAYILSGRFMAVVWSDVFQGSLMVTGLVALPFFGLAAAGGLEPAMSQLRLLRRQHSD